jgi:hypothetical protein
MATVAIRIVPARTGTTPNAPAPAIWSGRMAICGSQRSPNRNSVTGTSEKKNHASRRSEPTMPIVVRIAATEQNSIIAESACSTLWRAGKGAQIRALARSSATFIEAIATTAMAVRAMNRQRCSRSAAATISVDGAPKTWPAATLRISPSISRSCAAVASSVIAAGSEAISNRSMMVSWKSSHISTSTKAGTPTQIAAKAP